jgi:hypothetical protein
MTTPIGAQGRFARERKYIPILSNLTGPHIFITTGELCGKRKWREK